MPHSTIKRAAVAVAVLFCGALLSTPAAAQTEALASISATAAVVGVAPLTAAGVQDLEFGTVLAGVASTPPDVASYGRFFVTGEPLAAVSVAFTLPTVLTGPGGDIPISFGATDGIIYSAYPAVLVNFDPNATYGGTIDVAGQLTVGITGTVNPPAGTTTGTYNGTITLTVSYP